MINLPCLHWHALLALPLLVQDPAPAITAERIQDAYRHAAEALEKHLGQPLEVLPPLSLVDAKHASRAIEQENLPIASLRHPGHPERAAAEARLIGKAWGSMVTAKYSWSTKEILVVTENWARTGAMFPELRMTADDVLRAVLVHELVHAVDDHTHDLGRLLETADTAESVDAISAVVEGNAQFVARRACATAGWTDGFKRFTRSIGAVPSDPDESGQGQQMLLAQGTFGVRFPYVEGERFVTAVDAALGAEGRSDLFKSPPRDLEVIASPGWHLDPESKPEVLYDLEPALDHFVERFDSSIWRARRLDLNSAQLTAGLTMLDPEDVARIRGAVRGVRLAQLYPKADPQSKIALVAAFEFDTSESAAHFVEQSAKLSKLKEEAMREGVVRITESKTTPIKLPNGTGWLFETQMVNRDLEFTVKSADIRRGKIVIETTFSGDPPARSELEALLDELLTKPSLKR